MSLFQANVHKGFIDAKNHAERAQQAEAPQQPVRNEDESIDDEAEEEH